MADNAHGRVVHGGHDTRGLCDAIEIEMVVHGREDPIPLASSQAAARALGTECIVLHDCGHVPYVEQPTQLFPPLLAFLRERSVSTHSLR